jgi:hypothetical protein
LIYVFANDDRGLSVYATSLDAVAACEGVDVEDGNYRFFSSDGRPLQPRFNRPNRRGVRTVLSGDYVLEPYNSPAMPGLQEILPSVTYVEGCGLNSIQMVEAKINEVARD